MVWLSLVCQTGKATDATAQEVNAHQFSTTTVAEMALPGLLWRIEFVGCHLGGQ
jgi:hypothetical protein